MKTIWMLLGWGWVLAWWWVGGGMFLQHRQQTVTHEAAWLSVSNWRMAWLWVWMGQAVYWVGLWWMGWGRFGFGPACAMTLWLVVATYLWDRHSWPQPACALWPLPLMAGMGQMLQSLWPGAEMPYVTDWQWVAWGHWWAGLAAYGLLASAVLHALWMQQAERRMRQGLTTNLALPLITWERLTFRMVWAGFALLSVSLGLGIGFDWHLNGYLVFRHKTVFAALAWGMLGVLLWGRHRKGWRMHTAARLLYVASVWLFLSYIGSHFVLEILLHRFK